MDFYYTLGSPPCRAVMLMAKYLGVELNMKELDLLKKEQLKPEFIKINPQHTVPTIVDKGFSLWESNVILTYLAQEYGKIESLYPKDLKLRSVIDQRLYFNACTLLQRCTDYYYPIFMNNASPDPSKLEKIEEAFGFLNTFLEGHKYVAGNCLTVADFAIVSALSTYEVLKFDFSKYKNVFVWYNQVQKEMPNYQEINGKPTLEALYAKYFKKQ